MLDDRAKELSQTEYDPRTQAIDIVFTTVDDFVNLSALGHQPMTGPQTVAKAYLILNRSGKFKEEVKRWNDLPHATQTWDAFKTHFRSAHLAFRETTNVTLEQSELARSHANLVQQVVTGMQAALAAEAQPVANPETQEMFLQMSNSAAQASDAQLQLQHQLAQMQQHMQVMQAQMAASNPPQRQPVYPPPNYNPGFFPNQQQQQPTGWRRWFSKSRWIWRTRTRTWLSRPSTRSRSWWISRISTLQPTNARTATTTVPTATRWTATTWWIPRSWTRTRIPRTWPRRSQWRYTLIQLLLLDSWRRCSSKSRLSYSYPRPPDWRYIRKQDGRKHAILSASIGLTNRVGA
jgi:hypothetical protein